MERRVASDEELRAAATEFERHLADNAREPAWQDFWHADEGEDLALQRGELRLEDENVVAVEGEDVTLDVREETQGLFGGGSPGAPFFRIERKVLDLLAHHRPA